MVSLWQVVVKIHNFAGPLLMLAYPLYASVLAIESRTKEDETQWLTYWVLYSLIQLFEIALERVLIWIPFWYTLKLAFMCWLVLPQFHGAAFVYEALLKKYIPGLDNLGKGGKVISKQRRALELMSPQSQASISDFISEHGSPAFDRVMLAATSSATKGSS